MPGRPRLPVTTLFVHDSRIVEYHLRGLFSRLGDSLIAFVFLATVIALLRAQLSSLEAFYQQVAVAVAATAIASYLYYLLARRITFFRSDSVLAEVALHPASARKYTVSTALICGVAIAIALLAPDLSLTAEFLLNFCAGFVVVVLLSAAVASLFGRISHQKQERLERLLASRHRGAGATIAAAGGAAVAFVAACLLDMDHAAPIAAITSVCLGFWYSPVAYPTIEYEGMVGLSPLRSVWITLRDIVPVAGIVTGGALLSLQWQIAGIVLALFLLLLLYKSFEILTVHAFGGLKARFLMFMILLVVASLILFLPFSTPLLIPAFGWWLVARGRRRTWQLS